MSTYNEEQAQAWDIVASFLAEGDSQVQALLEMIAPYLEFRRRTDAFLETHFGHLCQATCYQSNLSACCSKEGIVTFFADVVINALASQPSALPLLARAVSRPNTGVKCVYLGPEGCLWTVKPIVCQMFVCQKAKDKVFADDPDREKEWQALKAEEKSFTWPDRPVLFDHLEKVFMDQGASSPLMYLHNSPGLLRIKKLAGLL